MAGKKIKKTTLLFPKEDLENILNDLINLEIFEASEPILPEDNEISDTLLKSEVVEIEHLGANQESLTILSTETTMYLTGWIWAKSEQTLSDMAARHICAWSTETPTHAQLDMAPIILKRPGFLYGLYKGHRDLFYPLGKKDESDE